MVNIEKSLEPQVRTSGPVQGVASRAANVMGDLVELVELQTRLTKVDVGDMIKASMTPLALVIGGTCGLFACLPILVLGLANCLDAQTTLNLWQAQLSVAGIGVIVTSIVVYASIRAIVKSTRHLQRSSEELVSNFAWARSLLQAEKPSNVSNLT